MTARSEKKKELAGAQSRLRYRMAAGGNEMKISQKYSDEGKITL